MFCLTRVWGLGFRFVVVVVVVVVLVGGVCQLCLESDVAAAVASASPSLQLSALEALPTG